MFNSCYLSIYSAFWFSIFVMHTTGCDDTNLVDRLARLPALKINDLANANVSAYITQLRDEYNGQCFYSKQNRKKTKESGLFPFESQVVELMATRSQAERIATYVKLTESITYRDPEVKSLIIVHKDCSFIATAVLRRESIDVVLSYLIRLSYTRREMLIKKLTRRSSEQSWLPEEKKEQFRQLLATWRGIAEYARKNPKVVVERGLPLDLLIELDNDNPFEKVFEIGAKMSRERRIYEYAAIEQEWRTIVYGKSSDTSMSPERRKEWKAREAKGEKSPDFDFLSQLEKKEDEMFLVWMDDILSTRDYYRYVFSGNMRDFVFWNLDKNRQAFNLAKKWENELIEKGYKESDPPTFVIVLNANANSCTKVRDELINGLNLFDWFVRSGSVWEDAVIGWLRHAECANCTQAMPMINTLLKKADELGLKYTIPHYGTESPSDLFRKTMQNIEKKSGCFAGIQRMKGL